MNRVITPAQNFPEFFRQDLISKIHECLKRGDNVTLIGLPGMGMSSLGMQLTESELVKDFEVLYLNLELLSLNNQEELLTTLKLLLENNDKNIALFIDPFEKAVNGKADDFLVALAGWRRKRIGQLSYIFALEDEVGSKERQDRMGPITSLVLENIIQLPYLKRKESDWFAVNVASQYNIEIKDELGKIYEMSGGLMQIIKRIVQARARGFTLDQLAKNPEIDIQLGYNLQRLKEKYLNQKVSILCPVFDIFMKLGEKKEEREWTRAEEKLVNYLEKRQGIVCGRDELMEAVWGKEKSFEVKDHSLTQLIHRVKRKLIKDKIETLRGRGVRWSRR